MKKHGFGIDNFNYRHGYARTKLYIAWAAMIQRVLNPKNTAYKNYGGRGITVCNEWLEFIQFRDWALNNGYTEGLQINRINNNGNYEPSNCDFKTPKENLRNTTRNVVNMGIANEIRTLWKTGNYTQKELASKYNVSISTILSIINSKTWKEG